eukprot:3762474-Pyramimonas_sp.AAC.1
MPQSSTRYTLENCPGGRSDALVKPYWGSGGFPRSASEALPGRSPRVPARVRARVEACRKLFRTGCDVSQAPPGILDRRRWAAGRHHHRPASNLKPSSSQRAPRELLLSFQQLAKGSSTSYYSSASSN